MNCVVRMNAMQQNVANVCRIRTGVTLWLCVCLCIGDVFECSFIPMSHTKSLYRFIVSEKKKHLITKQTLIEVNRIAYICWQYFSNTNKNAIFFVIVFHLIWEVVSFVQNKHFSKQFGNWIRVFKNWRKKRHKNVASFNAEEGATRYINSRETEWNSITATRTHLSRNRRPKYSTIGLSRHSRAAQFIERYNCNGEVLYCLQWISIIWPARNEMLLKWFWICVIFFFAFLFWNSNFIRVSG